MIMKGPEVLRLAGVAERRCIARDALGHYGSVVLSATYYNAKSTDDIPKDDIIKALKQCIREHPALSLVVLDADSEQPRYARVASIDLNQHMRFLKSEQQIPEDDGQIQEIHGMVHRDSLPDMAKVPAWRVYIAPKTSGFRLVLSWSHSLADGRSAFLFHATFLKALRASSSAHEDVSPRFAVSWTNELQPPIEQARHLPVSWSYLLRPFLNQYAPAFLNQALGIAAERPKDMWFGAEKRPEMPSAGRRLETSLRVLIVATDTMQRVLGACRRHHVRVTGLLNCVIARAIGKALHTRGKSFSKFHEATAIDLRRCIPEAKNSMGNYVSMAEDTISVSLHSSHQVSNTFSEEDWESVRLITNHLAIASNSLNDQPLSLLRYLNDFRSWILKNASKPADHTFELSNVGVFEEPKPDDVDQNWRVQDVVFTRSADCGGSALGICVASTKGGPMSLTVSWWPGMLGLEDEAAVVEEVLKGVRVQLVGLE